jgi:hypothetical protein
MRRVALPDLSLLARNEIATLVHELTSREGAISAERQILHRQIDALRAELVDRIRVEGQVVIDGADVQDDPGSAGVRVLRLPRLPNDGDGIELDPPSA